MQKSQLKKWGNSMGIRIPKNIIDDLQLEENATFEIRVDKQNKSIVLQVENSLTPYEKLMKNAKNKAEQNSVEWDRLEKEEENYK